MSAAFEDAPYEPNAAASNTEDAAESTRVSLPENNSDHLALIDREATLEPTVVATICSVIESEQLITAGRELLTRKYLKLGFISPDEVLDGVVENPYEDHSTHFAKVNKLSDGRTEVVARLDIVHWDPEKGESSFPVWQHKDELDVEAVAEIKGIGLEHCVEVVGLVKESRLDFDGMATLELYRTAFQTSLKNAHNGPAETVYLMAANPVLFEVFKANFNGYIKRIGPDLDYPGQEAIPAMIRFRDGTIDALHRMAAEEIHNDQLRFAVTFLLDGLDESDVDPEVAEALSVARAAGVLPPAREPSIEPIAIEHFDDEGGIDDVIDDETSDKRVTSELELEIVASDYVKNHQSSVLKEHLKRRKTEYVAAAGLIGYTLLRTLGVAHEISPETDVSWQAFLGIEIATTPTYVAGMGDIARSIADPKAYSRARKVGAALMAGSSFMAPYAYVLAEGEGMPKSSLAGVVALLGVSAASVFKRLRTQRLIAQEQI